jgi:hypothetical protein
VSAFFVRKVHITQEISSRKDHFKASLQKNLDQACFTTRGQRNKEAFEFNHEMLGGLSMWDPQGSPAMRLQVMGPALTDGPEQEEVQQLLHRIRVE